MTSTPPPPSPLRWGVAATGNIAGTFVEAFQPNIDPGSAMITAVSSRTPERASEFASHHRIATAHGSHEDMAADPNVDVVYIASLHPAHCSLATMFLNAGKHVLVEKPMALSAAEADQMIAAAQANNRFLMEAMWMRFNPVHVEALRRVADGQIGEVRRVTGDFSFALPADSDNHRLLDPAKGGSALLDLGVYPLSIAWWALGEPSTIQHQAQMSSTGVDEGMSLLCTWDSGATALITCSVGINGACGARIDGREGSIDFEPMAHASASATITRGGDQEVITGTPSLHHQVVEVNRCIRAGETFSPHHRPATSRAMLARFDEIRADLGIVYPGEGGHA